MFKPKWTIKVTYEPGRHITMESYQFRTLRATKRAIDAVSLFLSEEGRSTVLTPVRINQHRR